METRFDTETKYLNKTKLTDIITKKFSFVCSIKYALVIHIQQALKPSSVIKNFKLTMILYQILPVEALFAFSSIQNNFEKMRIQLH